MAKRTGTAGLLLYYTHLLRMRGLTDAEFGRVVRWTLQRYAPDDVWDRLRDADIIDYDTMSRVEQLMSDQLVLEAEANEQHYQAVCAKRRQSANRRYAAVAAQKNTPMGEHGRNELDGQLCLFNEPSDSDNDNGGERGIRTLVTLSTQTRFPVVRLQPAQPSLH